MSDHPPDLLSVVGAALKLAMGVAAALFLSDMGQDSFASADRSIGAGAVAVAQATLDGRTASGAFAPHHDDEDITLTAVPTQDAATAVAADQAVASYFMAQAEQSQENGRWFTGGAGVLAVATAGAAYVDASRLVRRRRGGRGDGGPVADPARRTDD